MKTPQRITASEFEAEHARYIANETETHGGTLRCAHCGRAIELVAPYVSLHIIGLPQCSGPGRVERPLVPYCPSCEDQPEERGCIHVEWHGTLQSDL